MINKKTLIVSAMEYETFGIPMDTFYTGVGKKNVRRNLKKLENLDVDVEIIFVGFAGALKSEYKLGQVFEISKVCLEDGTFKELSSAGKSILTVDKLLHKSEKLKKEQDFVDMESYYVVEALELELQNKNVRIFKVVSDELDFKFPSKLDHEVFQALFVNKNKLKKYWFLLKNLRLLKMYKNFEFARKQLAKFLKNMIEKEK